MLTCCAWILCIWFRTKEITLIFVRCFQQRGDGEAHANIIRQICEMFSALPLTFCALPPITHRQQQQAKADLPNGLPHTPEILLMLMKSLQNHPLEVISTVHPGRVTWLQDPKLHIRLEFWDRSCCSPRLLSTWPLPGLAETSTWKW